MKNVFFFLSILFVFSSCQNIEQYRAGIEDLSAKWETTGASVNDFAKNLNGEIANQAQAVAGMELPETVLASLSEEAKTQVGEAKTACTKATESFATIQQEVSAFMADWTTKSAEVTALTEGLAAGQLEGDVATKITELTTFLTDAETKMTAWNTSLDSAKAAVAASHNNYSTVLAAVMPADNTAKTNKK